MDHKETQNTILFKKEYEKSFLRLTKNNYISPENVYSNDEIAVYTFDYNARMELYNKTNKALEKFKYEVYETLDVDHREDGLFTRVKTSRGFQTTSKSLTQILHEEIGDQEFEKISDLLEYEKLNKYIIQQKVKDLFSQLEENNIKYYIENKDINVGIKISKLQRYWISAEIDDLSISSTEIIKKIQNKALKESDELDVNEYAENKYLNTNSTHSLEKFAKDAIVIKENLTKFASDLDDYLDQEKVIYLEEDNEVQQDQNEIEM